MRQGRQGTGMANASAKRQAAVNKATLTILRNLSVFIYASAFIMLIVQHQRYILMFLLTTPGFFAQYMLGQWCRPRYDERGQLVNPGHDINQGGVIDYVKDVMILYWVCSWLAMLVGLKAWLLLSVIPLYASFKGVQLLKVGKQMLSGPKAEPTSSPEPVPEPVTQKARRRRV